MASLSANVVSSVFGTRADIITHISHRLIFTARRSARDNGDPWKAQSVKSGEVNAAVVAAL